MESHDMLIGTEHRVGESEQEIITLDPEESSNKTMGSEDVDMETERGAKENEEKDMEIEAFMESGTDHGVEEAENGAMEAEHNATAVQIRSTKAADNNPVEKATRSTRPGKRKDPIWALFTEIEESFTSASGTAMTRKIQKCNSCGLPVSAKADQMKKHILSACFNKSNFCLIF